MTSKPRSAERMILNISDDLILPEHLKIVHDLVVRVWELRICTVQAENLSGKMISYQDLRLGTGLIVSSSVQSLL
jgi:hypothetical protein